MPEKTLEITVENTNIRVVVARATVLIGIRRTRLKYESEQETDIDRRLLRLYTYADVAACTTGTLSIEGKEQPWPPDFETFLNLPDDLVGQLENAVYAANPHWAPPQTEGTEAEKKVLTDSTSG